MTRHTALAALVLVLIQPLADAQVTVGGSIDQTTVVGNNSVSADLLSKATNAINAIDGVSVGGNLRQHVTVGNNTVKAEYGSSASNDIGGLYDSHVSGNVDRTIQVGRNYNGATSLFTSSKTRIGTVKGANVNGDMKQTIVLGSVTTHAAQIDTDSVTCIGTSINSGRNPASVYHPTNVDSDSVEDTFLGFGTGFGSSKTTKINADGC